MKSTVSVEMLMLNNNTQIQDEMTFVIYHKTFDVRMMLRSERVYTERSHTLFHILPLFLCHTHKTKL